MFEALLGAGVMVAPALLAAWLLAGYLASRLASRRTRGRLRLGAWTLFTVLGLAGLLTAVELSLVGQLWSYGWLFAKDRVILGLPQLVLPASAVLLFTAPRLWRVARGAVESKAPMDAAGRSGASDPLLVVPVQATAVGAALFAYLTWFPPGLPSPSAALTLWGLFVVSTAALWIRQRGRFWKLSQPEAPAAPGPGFRLLRAGAFALVICVGFAAWFAYSMQASALPDRFSMMAHENVDYGGGLEVGHGSGHSHHSGHGSSVSLTELTGPREGTPDRQFTLTAQKSRVQRSSGKVIEAWTFNDRAPGPELRARRGDLVEVTLINEDIEDGVSLHWHGIDVPNAEDGVAGLTQNAVRPGERHTYRFRAEQAGTYWYHSHQLSSEQVKKGLFGAFIVEPENGAPADEDITVAAHGWYGGDEFIPTTTSLGTYDTLDRRRIAPGKEVRLRLINTGVYPMEFTLSGTPFKVAAIDGTEINAPTTMEDKKLLVAAGGRYDVTFTMPETPVMLGLDGGPEPGILFSRDGRGEVPEAEPGAEFDPTEYGSPKDTPFGAESDFDREFEVVLDNRPGFYDGLFYMLWTINGEVFPDTPMLMVREGDLVKTTFVNRSFMDHPMHLHGHHMLVLSRNGRPVTGSPWWVDTLNVAPGESYEVAFRADNPGIWMDHCHNLDHAAQGMTIHLGYEGVTTPFEVGKETGNRPE
jgi:FtsP/CotA-like multicopper oxidase with cupredoxin domain